MHNVTYSHLHFHVTQSAIRYVLILTIFHSRMNTDLTIIGHEAIDIVGINQGTQDKLRKLKVMVMNLY